MTNGRDKSIHYFRPEGYDVIKNSEIFQLMTLLQIMCNSKLCFNFCALLVTISSYRIIIMYQLILLDAIYHSLFCCLNNTIRFSDKQIALKHKLTLFTFNPIKEGRLISETFK